MTTTARQSLFAFALATATGFVAATRQSLWIDEANSAVKATCSSLGSFVALMGQDRGSDLQMPLYMLMLWVWEKVFGPSEFALRSMNIPLFASAVWIVVALLHRPFIDRVFFAVFAMCSAFIWAYLDEARPYMLQFLGGVSCMVPMSNLVFSEAEQGSWGIVLFFSGIVILCASSLLGVVCAAFFGAAFLYLQKHRNRSHVAYRRKDLVILACACALILIALGTYYIWTLSVGARASAVGRTTPASAAFAIYELLGFAGLGPSRSSLREASVAALKSHMPALFFYGALLLSFFVTASVGLRRCHSFGTKQAAFWAAPAVVLATLLALGVSTGFRVLGRHCMPILPFVFLAMAMAATALWRGQHRFAGRTLVALVSLAMLSSALSYRFLQRHAKDDYRAAAAEAGKVIASNGVVWWAADPMGGKYYGLSPQLAPPAKTATADVGGVFMANSRSATYLADLPSPDLVVVSKRDIYDREAALEGWIRTHDFRHTARRPGFDFYTAATASE